MYQINMYLKLTNIMCQSYLSKVEGKINVGQVKDKKKKKKTDPRGAPGSSAT